jgi:glycosyltransferase involved in cell wall biosynthesis
VVAVSLDQPLRAIHVEEKYTTVLLVVISRGTVIGEIQLPGLSVLPPDLLRRVIARNCGHALWRQQLEGTFLAAAAGATPAAVRPAPTVSVVVCTRDRTDQLRACLVSLLALDTKPREIVVVDNSPTDDATVRLCADLPVRYVLEPKAGQSRARNRGILETTGELVAFTDDDCVVDPGWLDKLGETFADPLVMAATGYIGPAELETPAQVLFELHGGFQRGLERKVFDGGAISPVRNAGRTGAGANMIIRRQAFGQIGLFAEDLGPGTPARASDETYLFYRLFARGNRIVFDPAHIVWHRHRRDAAALRAILFDYGVAVSAFATRCLIRHKEPAALYSMWWWCFVHLRRQIRFVLARDGRRLPPRMLLAEMAGTVIGPWRLYRSRRSRRGIAPLVLPAEQHEHSLQPVGVHEADPPLSVVIPTHNRQQMLEKVLHALAAQDYPAERFETVVVLDDCTDGSAQMARSLELPFALRLVEPGRLGSAAKSRNRGAAEAVNPIVLFLDDDVVPDECVLSLHARAHRLSKDDHGALGYCPPWVEGQTIWELILRAWWEDHYRRRAESAHRWTYTDFASANSSLSRTLFLEHAFDETFAGRGREDWELGYRLLESGVRFGYYPRARAWHHLDTRFTTALRQRRGEAASDVFFGLKHPEAWSRLPVAAFFWSTDEAWLHEKLTLAVRQPARYDRMVRARLPLLDLLESLHLRARWRRQANLLFREAYVLGLVDALGSAERVNALAASIFQAVETMRVSLDDPSPLGIPAKPGAIELEVASGDSVLGRILAIDPGGQWDWEKVTQRVIGTVGDAARQAAVVHELEALSTPWSLAEVRGEEGERGH